MYYNCRKDKTYMILYTILILNSSGFAFLDDQTFPDHWTSQQFSDYMRLKWTPPTGFLDDFEIPPDVTLDKRLTNICPIYNYAYLFLVPSRLGSVTMRSLALPDSPESKKILKLLSQRLTSQQIALRMSRSPRWVEYQIAKLKKFYGVENRAHLIRRTACLVRTTW
jgi:DNA-binding CsgD family transcriptional regulator